LAFDGLLSRWGSPKVISLLLWPINTISAASERNGIEFKDLKGIGRDILTGLVFLHRHDMIHFDLKLDNVAVSYTDDGDLRAKLLTLERLRIIVGTLRPPEEHTSTCRQRYYR
jgi:serine/threonine protein kinase